MKRAFYFGAWDEPGHYLHTPRGQETSPEVAGMPWTWAHLDTGLLKNGKRSDRVDGRVWWTCGGRAALWFAFYWWDRTGDSRANSNSGLYVQGFDFAERLEAFDYACAMFPKVIARQAFPLVLQP